ncbi:Panacea domain-containing protein [Bifidobacterium cuniculi]|uniref:Putative prophage protein n=1 Tax=Bifidobacterium cuniculi TaxID=1688 RepID=A0A087B4L8_9BIFI|nr:type II toxin-antitoxin system antitoxin SocA domain-containing protein [Bifidobacterium cuniculi]KFI65968.1 putative prophage protein [Bifidobacterium cuniculi]
MHAIDVANQLLAAHGTRIPLTNRRINKLVYFTQVEALRRTGRPLFDDTIEAAVCGPVIPTVRDAFSQYGTNQVAKPTAPPPDNATLADLTGRAKASYRSRGRRHTERPATGSGTVTTRRRRHGDATRVMAAHHAQLLHRPERRIGFCRRRRHVDDL